jgi:hypothetical protein
VSGHFSSSSGVKWPACLASCASSSGSDLDGGQSHSLGHDAPWLRLALSYRLLPGRGSLLLRLLKLKGSDGVIATREVERTGNRLERLAD